MSWSTTKVDRLTRSLADFAKLVELFDAHGVSFASVTQSFNTTSGMGRLTLNVLLSFAQFEREVTCERIRDKIAACKQRGPWVGGMLPLGYASRDKKLVVVDEEAERVRLIFQLYRELGHPSAGCCPSYADAASSPSADSCVRGEPSVAVIQEAWIGGVSTRRIDDLVQAPRRPAGRRPFGHGSMPPASMGLSGVSKSQVSKLCKDIDERVQAFLERPLEGDWPYLWLDATYLKQREGGRIVSVAAIIAVAVNTDGRREIIGRKVGPSEAEMFWSGFLKSLVRRGLKNVKLVVSDAHAGLKQAIARVLGATWQRCRVPSAI